MLTLFTTPVVYLYLDRFSNRRRARRHEKWQRREEARAAKNRELEARDSGAQVTP
jgi:hypothetical protein